MDGKEFVNRLKDSGTGDLLRLAHYNGEECDGRGTALVLNDEIAVMLEDCGDPRRTGVAVAAFVRYATHEGESRIVGEPGYANARIVGGTKVGIP